MAGETFHAFCKATALFILLTACQQTAANQCYSCRSIARGTIDNNFLTKLRNYVNSPIEVKDCNIASDALPKVNCISNECRKTVLNPKNSDPFVVRYCGDKNLHTQLADDITTEECKNENEYRINCLCKGDLCNSGSSLVGYFVLVIFAVISLFYL